MNFIYARPVVNFEWK